MNKPTLSHHPLEMIKKYAEMIPNSLALRAKGKDFTYSNLLGKIEERISFFKENGVKYQKRCAIYTDDEYEMLISLYAIWGLGAICMPMNITLKASGLKAIEKIAVPDIGFYSDDFSFDQCRNFPMICFEDFTKSTNGFHHSNPDDCACIMFTSGTSGVPKAVPISFRAIVHNSIETSHYLEISNTDRILINSPPYYTSSIMHILTLFVGGGSVVIERGFMFGNNIIEQIKKNDCTCFGGVPVHFSRIVNSSNAVELPKQFRFLMNSGEHLPRPVIKQIRKKLPEIDIYCVYGLTEAAGRLCILDPKFVDEKIGSVGKPINGMSVTIRDNKGRVLPPDEKGEVFFEGCCLFDGYLNNVEANAKVMTDFGFATGDIGQIDSDGFLFLSGRSDDVIKVGGEKVSLNLIEEGVFGFNAFSDFSVVTIHDKHMGNVPCLHYVLKPNEKFRRKDFIKHIKSTHSSNHIPYKFIEVDKIQRSSSGKRIRK